MNESPLGKSPASKLPGNAKTLEEIENELLNSSSDQATPPKERNVNAK